MSDVEEVELEALAKDEGRNWHFITGVVITIGYFLLAGGFLYFSDSRLADMEPNEWGDFLAGAFGPLALLWVVLGFLQQGTELKNSRNALLLQAKELRHSVNAQKDLVIVGREQIAADKENFINERQADREKSQPRLRLLGRGSSGSSAGNRTFRFAVVNVGTNCSDVEILAYDSLRNGPVGGIPLLEQSADTQFSIGYAIDAGPQQTVIHAKYVDALGEQGERFFLIQVSNNTAVIVDTVGTAEQELPGDAA